MKLVMKAFIASIIIHLVFMVGIGYINTTFYKPDISGEWEHVEYLQNEVAFGMVISPFFFVFSFVGIACICGIIIYSYKRFFY